MRLKTTLCIFSFCLFLAASDTADIGEDDLIKYGEDSLAMLISLEDGRLLETGISAQTHQWFLALRDSQRNTIWRNEELAFYVSALGYHSDDMCLLFAIDSPSKYVVKYSLDTGLLLDKIELPSDVLHVLFLENGFLTEAMDMNAPPQPSPVVVRHERFVGSRIYHTGLAPYRFC